MTRTPVSIRTVYFLHSPDTNRVKIGVANDVMVRLKAMQTGSPVPLELAGVMRCEDGGSLEKFLHHRFQHLRVRGEWFTAAPELMDFITNNREPGPHSAAVEIALLTNHLLIRPDDTPRQRAIKAFLTTYPCRESYEAIKLLNDSGWDQAPIVDGLSDDDQEEELFAHIGLTTEGTFPAFREMFADGL